MIKNNLILVFLLLFSSLLCSEEKNDIIDFNGDGLEDITYEYLDDDGYYELIDRNFDGKKDESNKYTSDHYLISSKADDDFDGFSETQFIIKNSFVAAALIDSDYNQMFDTILYFKHGLVFKGEKFYRKTLEKKLNRIGKVKFKFGYPLSNEEFSTTKVTEKEFHLKALSLIKK